MNPVRRLLDELDPRQWREEGQSLYAKPEDCFVVMHVHVLPSFVTLLEWLIELGIPAAQIIVVGKSYSSIPSAVQAVERLGISYTSPDVKTLQRGLYDNRAVPVLEAACDAALQQISAGGIARAILVDDGGLLTEAWHRRVGRRVRSVVSIQQTASGFFHKREPSKSPYAKINVAGSAAKRYVENLIIAEGAVRAALKHTRLSRSQRVGVLGVGRIGRALANRLALRRDVWVYDPKPGASDNVRGRRCHSASEVIENSEVVFGCTGLNRLGLQDVEVASEPIQFVSCSSRDVEFNNLILGLRTDDQASESAFGTLRFQSRRDVSVEVSNWGFPINFDRETEWEEPYEISLTRALIAAAILQAMHMPRAETEGASVVCMLEGELQRFVVQRWKDQSRRELMYLNARAPSVAACESFDLEWWSQRSAGVVDTLISKSAI